MITKISAACGYLILSLSCISCQQEKVSQEPQEDLSDTTATVVADTTEFTFNPENEWLGLGVPQFGDLDSMVARRRIRALVPYTHLYYYIDGKERKGVAFEILNLFEQSINKQLRLKPHMVQIIFIPVNHTQVIPLLRDGYADLAYAGMTITEERMEKVDFSMPTITGLREIVVGGPASPKLHSLADLAGQELYVHEGSSYESAALKLSDSLKMKGLPPIIIKHVDPYLETEDMLEMVNSGAIPFTATVEDLAHLWSNVMDSLVLFDQFPLASNVDYGWVFRKDSPKLKKAADKFIAKNAKGTLMGNMMYEKYVKNVKLLPGMYNKKTMAQVKALNGIFQKYADEYHLDRLLLIAQGYQESQLNQKLTSHAGAVGIMQVKPSTAAGSPIYIKNINKVDNNVHAGVKYMRHIIDDYYGDPEIDTLNRHLLALATYNAGPGRLAQLRRMTKKKGLDPNKWFNNVEIIAAREIGRETVQYVSNIYKFYASYRALDYYVSQRGSKPYR
jgi:membrane-bound lytic murein transglycosylase MltF